MIKVGHEYIFNYCVHTEGDTQTDIDKYIQNTGSNVRVISYRGSFSKGDIYEVEMHNGTTFFAYDKELEDLKEDSVCCWPKKNYLLASELIKKLQQEVEIHGDVPVVVEGKEQCVVYYEPNNESINIFVR